MWMLRLGMAALAVFLISSSAPVLTDALAQDSSSDRDVLVTLYHATDGPNWENNDSWLSSAPIGEWYGVVTNADGRVSELNMFDNRLNGKIPPELGGLSSLDWLYLGDNQLSGKIPPELGNLANLGSAGPRREPVERGDTAGVGQPRQPWKCWSSTRTG